MSQPKGQSSEEVAQKRLSGPTRSRKEAAKEQLKPWFWSLELLFATSGSTPKVAFGLLLF